MSRRPKRGDDVVDGGGDLAEVADVHRHADAAPAHRRDRLLEVGAVGAVAQAEGDVGAGVGEREGDRPPDAPRRAGDQRRPPVEVEAGKSTACFVCHPRRCPPTRRPSRLSMTLDVRGLTITLDVKPGKS